MCNEKVAKNFAHEKVVKMMHTQRGFPQRYLHADADYRVVAVTNLPAGPSIHGERCASLLCWLRRNRTGGSHSISGEFPKLWLRAGRFLGSPAFNAKVCWTVRPALKAAGAPDTRPYIHRRPPILFISPGYIMSTLAAIIKFFRFGDN